MSSGLIGHDLYLRLGNGPVQQFRVWDSKRFLEAQMDEGQNAKEPYVVEVCTREEYLAERVR